MKPLLYLLVCLLGTSPFLFGQSIDDPFSTKKMRKDLEVFKDIRRKANSGLYKYRTKEQTDSIYDWAFAAVEQARTYRDFYNIICALTDFEGSTHNSTSLPEKFRQSIRKETEGYFPLPIKQIEGTMIVNIENQSIPLGAAIVAINSHPIEEILSNLYKYYTTDGVNISGKSIGIHHNFSKYYRYHYGPSATFEVSYKPHNATAVETITVKSVGHDAYYKNVAERHSKPFDEPNYKRWKEGEKYASRNIDATTSLLAIHTFAIGKNGDAPEHLKFVRFLDSTFKAFKTQDIKNLIVDIRYNGGGTDPNDLVAYEYLTQRNFSENKSAWISFHKIPCLRYLESKLPAFLRPIGAIKDNKYFRKEFPVEIDGRFYQDETSDDHQIRKPNANAFKGNIYLLISPRVASAGSNFGALVACNENTTIIGEETMGGFYGHNGHTPISYVLPKSKLVMKFSVVNLEQDVEQKKSQPHNRGIIPDHTVLQSYDDYLNQTDTQMNFTLQLIGTKDQ